MAHDVVNYATIYDKNSQYNGTAIHIENTIHGKDW